jgi:iron complex transport system permease protein
LAAATVAAQAGEPPAPPGRRRALVWGGCLLLLAAGAVVSLLVGAGDVSLGALLAGDPQAWELVRLSRLPRTVALLLAGAATAVAGVVMQMLVRNRFVEPSTIGTTESASLGLLAVTIWAPAMSMTGKIAVGALAAVLGTLLFLGVLRAVPIRSVVTVPLVGIMLGGVVGALAAYLAYRYDLMQTLSAWLTGDFSGVMEGRYELLWLVGAMALVVYLVADRFTVVGMGRDVATALGLGYRGVMALGLAVVAVSSSVVVVTVGALPFLGLVVPNVVSMLVGDNLRRSLPWVAVLGAALVLVCDVVGRLVIRPYEIPIGVVMGVVGAAVFLWLLLRKAPDVG